MRIYLAENSDPMITDSVAGLNGIAERLKRFLSSSEDSIYLEADTAGSPEPYQAFAPGLELAKTHGPVRVELQQKGLRVAGSAANLRIWCSYFAFPEGAIEGDHHHPEYVNRPGYIDPNTISVIIEVEDER